MNSNINSEEYQDDEKPTDWVTSITVVCRISKQSSEFILGIKKEWSNAHYKMIVEMKRTT